MSIDGDVSCALSECTYPSSYEGTTNAVSIIDLAGDGKSSMGYHAPILIRTNVEEGDEWDVSLLYQDGSQISSCVMVLSDHDYVDLGGWSLEGEIHSVNEDVRADGMEVPSDVDLNKN